MALHFFVNRQTRYCRALQGPPACEEHKKNMAEALEEGFVEVSGDEMDAFSAETHKAKALGWKPDGRTSYAKFMEKQGGLSNAPS